MSFQNNQVFADPRLNAISDFIIENLRGQFPDIMDNEFLLTGSAAASFQDVHVDEINNVTFITITPYFEWVSQNMGRLLKCRTVSFKNRLLFEPQGYFFELWFSDAPLAHKSFGGVMVQNVDDIPLQTLS